MELAEYDAAGKLIAGYVPGMGVDDRVAWIACGPGAGVCPGAATSYYAADRLGHVIAVFNATGGLQDAYRYSPYGVHDDGDPLAGQPFRYTGRYYDAETGLLHFRARYYDPREGRFLETDPVGYADQMNLYAYVASDPLNATDPTGQIVETVWDAANIAMGVTSLAGNVASGNIAGAAVDALGLVVDATATAVPGVPGGAGTAIKAARGIDAAATGTRAARLQHGAFITALQNAGRLKPESGGTISSRLRIRPPKDPEKFWRTSTLISTTYGTASD